jgi:hypothetical protein
MGTAYGTLQTCIRIPRWVAGGMFLRPIRIVNPLARPDRGQAEPHGQSLPVKTGAMRATQGRVIS